METDNDMTSLKGIKTNPVAYALGTMNVLFANKNDLVDTLDPGQVDQDLRVKAINSKCLVD